MAAALSSVCLIGATTTVISSTGRRSRFPKPLFLFGAPNLSPFSSVNPNSHFPSPRLLLPPPIKISASDSSQNSADPRINLTADVGPPSLQSTTAVGFSGDDAAATSAVTNISEKQYRMEAPPDLRLGLLLMFIVMLFCNNVFMFVMLRENSEEQKRRRFEESGSTVDRLAETEGEDESGGEMVGIRATSTMKGSDDCHVVQKEEVDERLGCDDGSVPFSGGELKGKAFPWRGRRDNPTMVVSKRFIMWGRQEGCRGVYRVIGMRSSRVKYSVNEDIFDGMRTKRNSKKYKEEEDEEGFTLDDMWWRTLPYVNAIYINTGSGEDIFFTFKMLDRPSTAYLVTFEDHTDAANFCYSCHTSFENPENFKAATIPLTLKDLLEITELKHVIVVRRGQFKFYVGQPFPEVEMALRSLIMRKLPLYDIDM